MSITNTESGTSAHEIAPDIYRISTPVPPSQMPGGFTFNQILVVDDEPLLFHTGPRKTFPLVKEAVAHVLGDVTSGGSSFCDSASVRGVTVAEFPDLWRASSKRGMCGPCPV